MNRTTQLVIGLLAVLLAIVAGVYGRNTYLKEVSTYQIPVPVEDIQPYTVLNESMFQMRDMPRAIEALPYYQSIANLEGMISVAKLPAGLPVSKASAVSPAQFRLADAAFEVISIPVEPVSAVGGQIRIGQRVNLYQMVKEDNANANQTNPVTGSESGIQVEQIANKVLVVDVRTSQGVPAGPNNAESKSSGSLTSGSQALEQVQILTLALAPDQVQTVLNAVAASKKEGGLLWTTLAVP
jgi:Flp pilus assembly protein CpaB